MTVQNFYKGLAMLIVSLVLTALGQTPIDVALLFVTGVSAILGYVGKNMLFITVSTAAWVKIVSGLLVAVASGLVEYLGLIVIDHKVIWPVLLKVTGGIFLTYITATFLSPPASQSAQTKKIKL